MTEWNFRSPLPLKWIAKPPKHCLNSPEITALTQKLMNFQFVLPSRQENPKDSNDLSKAPKPMNPASSLPEAALTFLCCSRAASGSLSCATSAVWQHFQQSKELKISEKLNYKLSLHLWNEYLQPTPLSWPCERLLCSRRGKVPRLHRHCPLHTQGKGFQKCSSSSPWSL